MKTSLKASNKHSFATLFHPKKLFIMLVFFGFTLLIYALSASGEYWGFSKDFFILQLFSHFRPNRQRVHIAC
jgi:hypothetical protein